MRGFLFARLVLHAVVLVLALLFTPIPSTFGISWIGYGWGKSYWFIWPQVIIAASAFYLDLLMFFRRELHTRLYWHSIGLEPLIAIGWWFPFLFRLWPGGDDGGGFTWLLFLGAGCALAVMVSAIGAWSALADRPAEGLHWPTPRNLRITLALTVSITAVLLVIRVGQWWYSVL